MIPDPLDRYNALLDRIESQEDETIPLRWETFEHIYPYSPFCSLPLARIRDSEGIVIHNTSLNTLGNNTLQWWIDLAYRAVFTVGIHLAIRASANNLIDDFSKELAMRLDTLDEELPF